MNHLQIRSDIYSSVIRKLLSTASDGELVGDFSVDPVYFCPLLHDISLGHQSTNYKYIKSEINRSGASESVLIARADKIVKRIMSDNASEYNEDLYCILELSPSASTDDIRKKWLLLSESRSSGDPLQRESINRAYKVLTDPLKRQDHDMTLLMNRNLVVKDRNSFKNTSILAFLVPLILLFIISTLFYEYYSFSSDIDAVVTNNKDSAEMNSNIKDTGSGQIFAARSDDTRNDHQESSPRNSETETAEPEKSGQVELKKKPKGPAQVAGNENGTANNPEDLTDKTSKEKIPSENNENMSTRDKVSPDGKSSQAETKKPPVRIDELLTGKNNWTVDLTLSYTNIDSTAESIELIDFPGSGGDTITFPVIINRQVDQDLLISSLSLRYGITDRFEVFGFSSMLADFRRASLGTDTQSDFDFNFNTAGIGATYQVLREDKYPALLATTSLNVVENTNFGTFNEFNEENNTDNQGGQEGTGEFMFRDDYELNFFKTISMSLSSYYTVDPIVFFIQGRYVQNFKRENDVSIDPGENFSLSPQIYFVVNPHITLNWGVRFSLNSKDRIDGSQINSTRTRLSPLFGVSYEIRNDLILSFDAAYVNDPDFNRASGGLRVNYNF